MTPPATATRTPFCPPAATAAPPRTPSTPPATSTSPPSTAEREHAYKQHRSQPPKDLRRRPLRTGPEALTRQVIEIHLAHLAERFPNPKSRTGQLSSLAGLLRASRQHGWEPRLAPEVDVVPEDYPPLMRGAPRALPEVAMGQ